MSERQEATIALIRRVKFQKWCSGMTQHRQDATVAMTRGVEVPGMVFWRSSGCANGSPLSGHFLQ
eukprot:4866564-Pyramimonas_sp.AAC.1